MLLSIIIGPDASLVTGHLPLAFRGAVAMPNGPCSELRRLDRLRGH